MLEGNTLELDRVIPAPRSNEGIDLLAAFQERGRREKLYRLHGTHWNPAGNQLAADVISEALPGETQKPGLQKPAPPSARAHRSKENTSTRPLPESSGTSVASASGVATVSSCWR